MYRLRADLHVHTILSPCADLSMSPMAIIQKAKELGIHVIAITDHNSTLQAPLVQNIGKDKGVGVIMGAELTSREEVHCLVYLPNEQARTKLQAFIHDRLPNVPNRPEFFGDQLVVNQIEEIIYEEPYLLSNALNASLYEIIQFAHSIHALVVPAHIDKGSFSIYSQLGFIPNDLQADAFEVITETNNFFIRHPDAPILPLLQSSDAHYINYIGHLTTMLPYHINPFEALRLFIRKK